MFHVRNMLNIRVCNVGTRSYAIVSWARSSTVIKGRDEPTQRATHAALTARVKSATYIQVFCVFNIMNIKKSVSIFFFAKAKYLRTK